MSIRLQNILLAVFALFFGLVLYVLFRDTTYVAILFRSIPIVDLWCQHIKPDSNAVFAFYLPDFLWSFSFCCFLNAIYDSKTKGIVLCGVAAVMIGVVWEVLQYVCFVTGTGDILDMVTYFLAALLATIINLGGNACEKV